MPIFWQISSTYVSNSTCLWQTQFAFTCTYCLFSLYVAVFVEVKIMLKFLLLNSHVSWLALS